jgi:hypothetical protein
MSYIALGRKIASDIEVWEVVNENQFGIDLPLRFYDSLRGITDLWITLYADADGSFTLEYFDNIFKIRDEYISPVAMGRRYIEIV